MSNKKSLPSSVTDFLMHIKEDETSSDGSERVILPFTRYANIFNAPKVVSDVFDAPGSPFVLYSQNEVELEDDEIRELCGDII